MKDLHTPYHGVTATAEVDKSIITSTIDGIIEKAHKLGDVPLLTSIANLKRRLGYYAYVDGKRTVTHMAVEKWTNFKNEYGVSLPLSLEDELAVVFYIYIYHDTPERKRKALEEILSEMKGNNSYPEIIALCDEDPIHRPINKENGVFN